MNKIEKYELMYIKVSWIFSLTGMCFTFFSFFTDGDERIGITSTTYQILFYFLLGFFNIIKYVAVRKGLFNKAIAYQRFRIIEISILTLGYAYYLLRNWEYILVVLLLLITTLCKGIRTGVFYIICASILHVVFLISMHVFFPHRQTVYDFIINELLAHYFFYYLATLMLGILCGMIYNDELKTELENKRLVRELEEKYEQLASAQEEVKSQYETVIITNMKLEEINLKLENSNKKLANSIAEFYTLQEVTRAISSIFETDELLKHVNDIILGVMGVNTCTVVLYDEKSKKLKVHTTNISDEEELQILNDNISSDVLINVLDNNETIIDNFVDEDEFIFTKGRNVNSLLCVPIITKTRKFGLVIAEHRYYKAFDEENVRLLSIIGQQVGIAMENAELYKKMQELATLDGLTGVHNKLFFQERLVREIENAREGNYKLSLAILDIDYFKIFNDTYGHLFGDMVLKNIASTIKNSVRSSDIVARFGGEELVILLPRMNLKDAHERMESLREKIAGMKLCDEDVAASVTVSFGIACFPDTSLTDNELLQDADDALYQAKAAGRNCIKLAVLLEN